MNESKVVTYLCVDFDLDGGGYMEPQDPPYEDQLFVTHADYRALEERKCAWYECAERLKAKVVQLEEEIAALRKRYEQNPK